MITFECPSCHAKLQVKDEHAGKTIQCPTCKEKATAPASASEPAAAIKAAPPQEPATEPTAVTTPENTAPSKKRREREIEDEDEEDGKPRHRSDAGSDAATAAAGAGIGIGMIIAIVVGITGCCGVGVVAILVALLVPAVQKVREAAARTQSVNNVKQICLAMQSFHDTHKRLPFNGSDLPAKNGGGMYSKTAKPEDPMSGSWAFQITPYCDLAPLFVKADRTWPIQTFMCPGRGRPPIETTNGGGAWSDYFYNNYLNDGSANNRPDGPDVKRTLLKITDGTSNTIFAGHGNIAVTQYASNGNVLGNCNIFTGGTIGTTRGGNAAISRPGGVILSRDSAAAPGFGNWGGPFPNGAVMGFCDGTVRLIPYTSPDLNAFLTPTGNEPVPLPDF